MVPYNFHTHSSFSDGSNSSEDYILAAIKQNFKGLGFSEHSVLPFNNSFALQKGNETNYCNEVGRLKEKYKEQLEVYLALEADYIPGLNESFKELKERLKLDYLIGSVHLVGNNPDREQLWFIDGPRFETYDEGIDSVFNGNIREAVTAYWHQLNNMIENEEFDIIGHLDKIKMHNRGRWFDESTEWYTSLINETIDLIAQKDLMVEINTRGVYKKRSNTFFPGREIISQLNKNSVRVVLSSDAHNPSEISLCFDEAIRTIKECGYSEVWVYSNSSWVALPVKLPS